MTIRKLPTDPLTGTSKYKLLSSTGRNLGTFPSLARAKIHERQVNFFKHRASPNR